MTDGPMNPWLSVWTRPRDTIRGVVETAPARSVLLIAALAGIAGTLDRASGRNAGDKLSLPTILAAALVAGSVWGVVRVYLGAALLGWTGRWVGGRGTLAELRAAVAWSSLPVAVGLVLWVPALLIYGHELFTEETPALDAGPVVLALGLMLFGLAGVVLGVWSLVLLVATVSEVQRFSAWKAVGNLALAGLVLFVPLVILAVAIVALK